MFHPKGPTFLELAVQALSSTERGYDLLAPKFDYTPFRTPDELLSEVAAHIGGPGSVGSALDVCCGSGAAMKMLLPLCRDRIVGLDRSRGMLDVCRRRLRLPAGDAKVLLVRADALSLPFDSEFDVAVCFGAQGHFLPWEEPRLVAQISRALKPGGRFVFVSRGMPSLWSAGYWLSRGFNAAMHVRNFLIAPPFIMYYLRFLLPEVKETLERQGFAVAVRDGVFGHPFAELRLVIATRG